MQGSNKSSMQITLSLVLRIFVTSKSSLTDSVSSSFSADLLTSKTSMLSKRSWKKQRKKISKLRNEANCIKTVIRLRPLNLACVNKSNQLGKNNIIKSFNYAVSLQENKSIKLMQLFFSIVLPPTKSIISCVSCFLTRQLNFFFRHLALKQSFHTTKTFLASKK